MNYKKNSQWLRSTILRVQRLKKQRNQSSHEIFLSRVWEKKKRKQMRRTEKWGGCPAYISRTKKSSTEMKSKRIEEKISKLMQRIWSRRIKTRSTTDILLDGVISDSEYQICHKIKTLQMRIGEIWQEVIGCAEGWQSLKQGHLSGLDLINHKRKIAIELKNSTPRSLPPG